MAMSQADARAAAKPRVQPRFHRSSVKRQASQLTALIAPVLYGTLAVALIGFEARDAETARILFHPTASFVHERVCSIAKCNRNRH